MGNSFTRSTAYSYGCHGSILADGNLIAFCRLGIASCQAQNWYVCLFVHRNNISLGTGRSIPANHHHVVFQFSIRDGYLVVHNIISFAAGNELSPSDGSTVENYLVFLGCT